MSDQALTVIEMPLGMVYGRLTTVLESVLYLGGKRTRAFLCHCECGQWKTISAVNLRTGNSLSCGCLRHAMAVRHGRTDSREYKIWQNMRSRCENPKATGYHRYGGRGITVCERWKDFDAFFADMGCAPAGYVLDRRDNDRGYSPENCRWVTSKVNTNNRDCCRRLEINGIRKTAAEWSEETGVGYETIRARAKRGVAGEALIATTHERFGGNIHVARTN